MTPDLARAAALDLHYRVAKGENPTEEEQAKRLDKTLKEIHPIYEAQYSNVYLKPSTVKNQEYLWEFVLDYFGSKRINSITKLDIEKFMLAHKDTPYQANRLFALVSKVFSMCEQWEFKPQHSNPCRGVRKFKEHARERYLSKQEIEKLFAVLDKRCAYP